MSVPPALPRILAGTLVALLAGACGGRASSSDDNNAGSGQGGYPGAGAGAVSSGGKPSSGGKVGSGGAVGTSGTLGTSGTFGSGGAVAMGGAINTAGSPSAGGPGHGGEACTAPWDPGPCEAYFETWFHDPSSGICRPSYYGGCGGNANRYASRADCQKACSGGVPNYDSCKTNTDCTLGGATCCGACDGPSLTERDFIAYSSAGDPACDGALDRAAPAGGSGNIGLPSPAPGACVPCPAPAPGTGTAHFFVPECVAGQCSVTDIRTSPATACKTSDECRLRRGTSCCESCDSDLLAVRNDGSFEQLVCGGILPPCAACQENPAVGAMAVCANGRCAVAYRAD